MTTTAVDDVVWSPFPLERMVLAIVGSAMFARGKVGASVLYRVHGIVGYAIGRYQPEAIVSGGAIGVDMIARTTAEEFGYHTRRSIHAEPVADGSVHEFIPRFNRWRPEGFEARNRLIAQHCTHLLCIRSDLSTTYGSGWTADRAEGMGKPVKRIKLPSDERVEWPEW